MGREPRISSSKRVPWVAIAPAPSPSDLSVALDDDVEILEAQRIVAKGRFSHAAVPKGVEEAFLQHCLILTVLARMARILLDPSIRGSHDTSTGGVPSLGRTTARVRRPIETGAEILFEARILKAFGDDVAVEGLAMIAGEVCAESEMYFKLPSSIHFPTSDRRK